MLKAASKMRICATVLTAAVAGLIVPMIQASAAGPVARLVFTPSPLAVAGSLVPGNPITVTVAGLDSAGAPDGGQPV